MNPTNKTKPFARPYPQYAIEESSVRGHGLISIAPKETHVLIPQKAFEKVLRLTFDDVPFESFQKGEKTYRGPSMEELHEALAFSHECRREHDGPLSIHCQAGKSRSAALALIINIHHRIQNEQSKEITDTIDITDIADIVGEEISLLLSFDPDRQMCFNPKIISDGEKIVGTPIDPILSDLCPAYVGWKKYWGKKTVQG